MWWEVLLGVLAGFLLLWLVLVALLWRASRDRPDKTTLTDALRLIPDVIRLVRRLAADGTVPRRVRVVLLVLLAYLVSPIDLIPDFIPVLGYADDAIIVAVVLRFATRHAGAEALERHWPGTPQGLQAMRALAGL
ncbi:Protein of unknown function [Cryobacterium psychrotolerans]|uniref:DUF1232 domain-containing protein n=1 Tax=Cryobacterium psychrotolerans TaxID=386301 RepID=A0A1G9EDX2_9MICO|nr:DUF1232 domain-containing protein [Cryobacterium psychrotolerans]TFD88425.1 DUF1232 domain-containing protein [Cryobacterium psychrotolerans]SDK74261.1 Protein of unknown function [Cryobacterium psychrotolerans]